MDIPKKKVIIKVKPHTILVGAKKPDNGSPPDTSPPIPTLRKSLFSRCVDVIKEDLHRKKIETGAVLKDPNEKWEEYLKFCELAERGKKP